MHSELLARLEAATGPDRELDAAIFAIVHPDKVPSQIVESGYGWRFTGQSWWLQTGEDDRCPRKTITPPAYTASIDAALTLVPSTMNATIDTRKPAAATLGGEWVYAATPALAIVIAALRAKGDA